MVSQPVWINRHTFFRKVFTSYCERPNGWTATVTDDTATHAPFRGTKYHVSAICRHWCIQHPATFKLLEDARNAALEFTDLMPQCLDIPGENQSCRAGWETAGKIRAAWKEAKIQELK